MTAYSVYNPGPAMAVFYDGLKPVSVRMGETVEFVELSDAMLPPIRRTQPELVFTPFISAPVSLTGKPLLRVNGMNGIGDCLHQRAVMRELMKTNDVFLATAHWHMYHDLVDEGLKLIFQSTRLRAQAKTIAREKHLFVNTLPPSNAQQIKLWYRKDQIDIYGSILEAQLGSCGCDTNARDFSMPVKPEWTETIKRRMAEWPIGGKPILVYRPVVLRREWNSANRNPDPDAYNALFAAARPGYFVVSIADLQPGEEWIVGEEQDADIKLHKGELPFEEMAALFQEANLVFANAGFGPVLAQAVGTPSITVYGGRESYKTTQRAGEHLAPTLGIDCDGPCDCHSERHDCGDKHITLPPAIDRVRTFAETYRQAGPIARVSRPSLVAARRVVATDSASPRILIYGTVFVDCPERQKLTEQWLTLTAKLNPDCDLLLVDSASPTPLVSDGFAMPERASVFDFGDNIGHLSRKGRDGWGRAFCRGLEMACAGGYDYAVHIEGDALFRLPVRPIIDEMKREARVAASTEVRGTERIMRGWVETGLMFFSVPWVKKRGVVAAYDWRVREVRPTPEVIVGMIIAEALWKLPLKALRGDKNQITHENILSLDLDWVTHCHNDVWAYDRFFDAAMKGTADAQSKPENNVAATPAGSAGRMVAPEPAPPDPPKLGLKLNLGCGTNKLKGWENHDADVDITKPLPWADNAAAFIFIEHCVEHVSCHEAIRFFEEAHRVLKPGGVIRVTVPSIEKIRAEATPEYFSFTQKWGGEATLHGALKAIIFSHGHQMIWTASVMREALLYAGFAGVEAREVGQSPHEALRGAEGHGRVIGDAFNRIESMCFEATRGEGSRGYETASDRALGGGDEGGQDAGREDRGAAGRAAAKIAVVVGGATVVDDEILRTRKLLNGHRAEWFVVNDMIERYPGPCVAVSLHPTRLKAWLDKRAANRHAAPKAVWCNIRDKTSPVTNVIEDWRGSSGLFAARVALHLGYERVILCGVPMDPKIGNIRGTRKWDGCAQFTAGWIDHHKEIAPYVRSWSGWTKQRLGAPDAAFLKC